jgi:glycosyltransferase involved in cell wall biosynthesis
MKITIVLGAFLPVPPVMGGAVEKAWSMLAEEFAARGHEVVVVSRAVKQFPPGEVLNGVRHIRVPGFNAPRSLAWLKFLDFIYSVRAKRILPSGDIVVTNTFWLPILLRNRNHGHVYVHVARYPKGQMRLYSRVARLQTPSKAVARAVAIEIPPLEKRIRVIPYPAPPPVIKSAPSAVGTREKIILFVGRVHPEKGVHLLVKAFADEASTVFAGWKLMIVGPVEEKFGGGGASYFSGLEKSAVEAGNQVVFAGPIFDGIKLEQTFRGARLFVYPSLAERGESFGLAPLEAIAQGCPALVSDLECFRDFIHDGETGFVFNHRSANVSHTLGEKMKQIIADEAFLGSVAAAGYNRSANYTLPRVADQFLSDFDSLMRNSDVSSPNR